MDPKQGFSRIRRTAVTVLTLGVPILAIAVSVFAQSVSKRDQTLQECARVMARGHLLHRHWRVLETDKEFGVVIDAMFNETLVSPNDASWKVKTIMQSETDSADLNDFERSAFKQLATGESDVADFSRKDGFRYVGPVRLKDCCLSCHQVRRGQPEQRFKAGDVIAFVSLKREPPARSN